MADLQIMSFNAGELTPLVDGRSDLEKYYSGCRLLENMIPLPYGPAERRPGTYFVAECKNNDKKARLIPFQYSTEQAYILEYGDEYIRFCMDRGQIVHGVGTAVLTAVDGGALVAHWLLDEDEGLAAVNADNPGTYDGTATVDTSILNATGKVGTGCFDLDGQYTVEIADAAAFSFTNNLNDSAFSIACWGYVTQQAAVQVLLSKWRDQNAVREWRFSLNSERKLQLHLADTSADLSGNVVAQWKLNDDAADTNVICSAPTYDVATATADGADTITISGSGDLSASFPDASEFTFADSSNNDGQYVVASTGYADPVFTITTAGLVDSTDDGTVAPHAGVSDDSNTADINATGKINGCLDFGGNQAMVIDDSADFSFGNGDDDSAFSIAAWVYVVLSDNAGAILSKADFTDGAEVREWRLIMYNNEELYFALYDESANAYVGLRSQAALSSGWHFVVATYDGSGGATAYNGMNLYVDGELIDVDQSAFGTYDSMENTATKVVIGAQYGLDGNLGASWRDKIDNVVLFDIELTPANISALYNSGAGTETMAGAEVFSVTDDAIGLGWHFLAATCSTHADREKAADDIILYVDGVAVDFTAINDATYTAMQGAGEAVRIGSQNSIGDTDEKFWGDKIDEVSIFSDVLTPTEIASLYSTTPYEIVSPYLEADLFGLQRAQSADVLFNVHGSYPQSKLMRYAHTVWELEDIVFDWPSFLEENITDTTITPSGTVGTIDLTASTPIFTSGHVGSYWLIKHPRTDNKIEHNFGTAVGYSPILVDVKGSWRLRTAGTWTGRIELQRTFDEQLVLVLDDAPAGGVWSAGDIITGVTSTDTCIIVSATDTTHYVIKQLSGSFTDDEVLSNQVGNSRACAATWPRYEGWHTIEPFQSVDDQNFNVPGNEEGGNAYYRVECTAADDAALNITLSCERYYHYGIVKITGFTDATHATGTVIRTLGAITATKLWSEGAWSDERGYPVTTAFFEGRLFYAGTAHKPLNIWGSVINDYDNMDTGNKLDDDAVKFTVDSSMQNMIRWLVGQEILLIGTSGGEWRLGSSDPADAITPSNPMRPKQQTTYGSKEIQALLLANAVLFVDAQGKKVRGAQWIFEKGEAGGYDAPDYTMLAEHITESGIVGMAYQQNPSPILWCVREDGVLIGMVFEPGQKVWGWFRCVIDGDVESVAVIPGVTEDEVWIIVKREINGSDKRYIEYFKPRDWGDDQADCFFVDSGLTFDGGAAVTITGISRADPCVVTVANTFSDGDQVKIKTAVGMTEVNDKVYTVSNPSTTDFELRDKLDTVDIDSTGFTTYVSGGTVEQVDNAFSGLDHLEGETVSVLGDGSVHADVVVSSGSVILTDYFNKVHIGLPYTSSLMPMKLAVPGANIRGKKKRIHQIIFSFDKTLGAKFGPTSGDDTIPFRKTTDPMGYAPPLFTGEKVQTFPAGYELNADIYVEQTQPLPMTVRSITARLKVYG